MNIVVLAAGEGTRMKSVLPKVLHQISGRSMLGHVLAVAEQLGAAHTVVVCAANTIGQISATFGPRYAYVVQHERLGTGHAVLQARELLADSPGEVLVLYADSPLIQAATAQSLVDALRQAGALVGLLSFHATPLVGYGRVLRDQAGQVLELVEERNASPDQLAISEGNSGFMAFDGAWLWSRVGQIPRNPVKGEFYLTDLVAMAVAER
ncbi:MAG: NTP transferase domain-containing protein, partial [Roseiflexaceae bacterium]|nr:NTP transferase domain-containing protein [Roseiflexaceae bacterium]